ncbi:MAG: glutamate racemase, partial [Bacteroidota bacterium]
APIGVFDSGFGGLTVLKEIVRLLPQYDYLYLGDNARAPYGNRSFDTVHEYTLQCVELLFDRGCQLVILACNTASAKALRTIQQKDLPTIDSTKRVLGVIRPTTEMVGNYSKTKNIGVLGTLGTISSMSYPIEIEKFFPGAKVFQQACPMWVPLVENNEFDGDGADYFIKQDIDKLLSQNNTIDTIILACTHYPLLINKIKKHLPAGIHIVSQGEIVAHSLVDYLNRHQDMESRCTKGKTVEFITTDSTEFFDRYTQLFFGQEVKSQQVVI